MTKARIKFIKDAFDLTPPEWDRILAYQGGVCFICEEIIPGHPHTDHNHKTGQVRGILCSVCNRALGKIEDPRWQKFLKKLYRVVLYLASPPATGALGREVFGYPGKITHRGRYTKRYKEWVKNREHITT